MFRLLHHGSGRTQVPSQARRGRQRRALERDEAAGRAVHAGRRHDDAGAGRHRPAGVAVPQQHEVEGLVEEQAVQVGQCVVDPAAQSSCQCGKLGSEEWLSIKFKVLFCRDQPLNAWMYSHAILD